MEYELRTLLDQDNEKNSASHDGESVLWPNKKVMP
jgi:hypothetical protein